MLMRRLCAMAIAGLAMAGCVSSSYAGSYDRYPSGAYGLDYDSNVQKDSKRYFRPARNVTCDRARDVCYDRYGLSYHATARYLGEREANRSYKKYGNKVFLFSPKRGVTCDRRTQTCSGGWSDRVYGNAQPQKQYWPMNRWND